MHIRSAQVADGRGQLSVVPTAYHQPGAGDLSGEVNPYWTILREIYEEIFEGSEVQRLHDVGNSMDWFCGESAAVAAIRDGQFGASLKGTAFGINAKQGHYILAALVTVADPSYWRTYEHKMKPMYEHADGNQFPCVSSRDEAALRKYLVDSSWSGDALFAFSEGLLELKRQFPNLVSLPKMERWG